MRIFTIIFVILQSYIYAQNEATRWRFNTNAGLDFLTSPPTPTVGGPVISNLCGMSIADAAGNLLFYSNGFEIYDAQGGLMAMRLVVCTHHKTQLH